jgi:hypothetical protein
LKIAVAALLGTNVPTAGFSSERARGSCDPGEGSSGTGATFVGIRGTEQHVHEVHRGKDGMKFKQDRSRSDPEAAARKLLKIANGVEAIQDGRIYIETINWPFLHARRPNTRPGLILRSRPVGYGCMRAAPM